MSPQSTHIAQTEEWIQIKIATWQHNMQDPIEPKHFEIEPPPEDREPSEALLPQAEKIENEGVSCKKVQNSDWSILNYI